MCLNITSLYTLYMYIHIYVYMHREGERERERERLRQREERPSWSLRTPMPSRVLGLTQVHPVRQHDMMLYNII